MNTQFKIENIGEGTEFHQIIVNNTSTKEFVSILPALGARLNAAHLSSNGDLISVLSELHSSDFKTNDELFNNALLFPFAGRIRKGFYTFQNQNYQLPVNYSEEENACHGFLYIKKFQLLSKRITDDFAEIELSYRTDETTQGYPYLFSVNVIYRLSKAGEVTVLTRVENLSESSMLFSNGWHLYYTLGNSVDDWVVEFNSKEKIELNKFNVPTGSRVKFNNGDINKIEIADKQLDDVFKLSSENGTHYINLVSRKTETVLNIWQESGANKYNYLVLYTPPDRKSIAIEPITSNIDSFNNKEDIIILNPGNRWTASYGFELNRNNK
jgi:aldose 1-epimerase